MWLSSFSNDTATTEIYTLSLHDALPISPSVSCFFALGPPSRLRALDGWGCVMHHFPWGLTACAGISVSSLTGQDRKSTRLNSSHANISYAVFCLKKTIQGGGDHGTSGGD